MLTIINKQEGEYLIPDSNMLTEYFFTKKAFDFEIGHSLLDHNNKDLILPSTSRSIRWIKYNHMSYELYNDSRLCLYKMYATYGRIRISKRSLMNFKYELTRSYNQLKDIYHTFNKNDRNISAFKDPQGLNNNGFGQSYNSQMYLYLKTGEYNKALKLIKYLLNGHSDFFHKYYLDYLNKMRAAEFSRKALTPLTQAYKVIQTVEVHSPNSLTPGTISLMPIKIPNERYIYRNIPPHLRTKTGYIPNIVPNKEIMNSFNKDLRNKLLQGNILTFYFNGGLVEIKPPTINNNERCDFSKSIFINNKPFSECHEASEEYKLFTERITNSKFKIELFKLLNTKPESRIQGDTNNTLYHHLIQIRKPNIGERKTFRIKYQDENGIVKNKVLRDFNEERAIIQTSFLTKCFPPQIIEVKEYGKI